MQTYLYIQSYTPMYVYIAHAGKGLILLGIGNFNHGAAKACGLNQVCILYYTVLYCDMYCQDLCTYVYTVYYTVIYVMMLYTVVCYNVYLLYINLHMLVHI